MEKEVNDLLREKFLCQTKFTQDIEKLVQSSDLNYIEAIITYCEEHNIELESVNKLISKPLKEKLKVEAQDLNYLKKTTRSRLPSDGSSRGLSNLFEAFKNHFSKETYDFFKYKGRVSASKAGFNKRKDKYFFERMSRKNLMPRSEIFSWQILVNLPIHPNCGSGRL